MDVMKNHTRASLVAALAVLALSAPSGAQELGADSRWLPFVGCWESVGGEDEIGLLCFTMEGEGVTLTNYVGGEAVSTETLVADGRRQQVSVEGCAGFESVRFSEDGHRVFTQTEFLCGTDEPRAGTGVMAFLGPNTWADVRTLAAGDEPFAWVQEYRLASAEQIAEAGVDNPAAGLGMAVRTGRAAAATRLDLDDVVEASESIDTKAVETWLVAKRDRFDPTGQDLLYLAEAGVPDEVIDAVVAVSHPEKFYVALGDSPPEYGGRRMPPPGYVTYSPFWGPAWGLSFRYGYGYAPGWGYPGWGYPGWGYPGWGYRPGNVVIGKQPQGGRVYNGRGYSSGSRSGSGGSSSARAGRRAQPRGGSQPSYSTGSRGGASAAPSGSRSGGRQATPRRAVRRPSGSRPPGGR